MPKKVMIPLFLIVGAAVWLASTNLSKANYFYNVHELPAEGSAVYKESLKIKGRIVPGTIMKKERPVRFTIQEEGVELKVAYVGSEPLPDMFKDHAEAVVEGRMNANGTFEAVHLQAKCASKYEAASPEVTEATPYQDQQPVAEAPAPPAS